MKSLPLGQQSFADLRSANNYYVDKTPFIKAVMEYDAQVLLMTRPRRFGKTLFMDTLQRFLEIDPANPGNSDANTRLFAGLKILEDKAFCDHWMGQHPVIGLTFKDVAGISFETAYKAFANRLSALADQYAFLLESPKLTQRQKTLLARYRDPDYLRNPNNQDMAESFLKELSTMVAAHYGRKVIILIDEYDVPLAKAAAHGYYDEMVIVIRNFLCEALKPSPTTDDFLFKAVLTGCLRVSKESIFTGLNNPGINTVCSEDRTLNQAIGFTTGETQSLLEYYGLASRFADVKQWYDGYRFAGEEIYCPWDVINFCNQAIHSTKPLQYQPENYWEGTGSNDAIAEFLGFLTTEDATRMQTLVDGNTIDLTINDKLTYSDFAGHNSDDFWTLLLFTGYLTVVERLPGVNFYRVKIPNEEIRLTFENKVRSLYSKANKQYAQHGEALAAAFLSGDADAVRKILMPLLRRYVSVRDEATKAPQENYYHGFLLAMLICAGDKAANLHSNTEAGAGFADLVFTSEDLDVGVVIEVKRCAKPEEMPQAAQDALEQIKIRRYAQAFDGYQCAQCFGFGVSFCKKLCVVKAEALPMLSD